MNSNHQVIARGKRGFAVFVTATAMVMSGIAGFDRGGDEVEQALMVALFVAICAGTHFIPALANRPLTWLLWVGCLLGTVFGHVTFFTHANLHAEEIRAQHSVQKISIERQIEVINETLTTIKSRPVAVVAEVLASSQDWRQRPALRAELAEAKRAAALRDELVRISATATSAMVVAGNDPVTAVISDATGSKAASINLAVNLGFSMLMELLGAQLWWMALRRQSEENISSVVSESQTLRDPIAELREAVASGKCLPTVSGIRKFLGCGQNKALEMRRALLPIIS